MQRSRATTRDASRFAAFVAGWYRAFDRGRGREFVRRWLLDGNPADLTEGTGPKRQGFTLLHVICERPYDGSVRLLLRAGADPDRVTRTGAPPLYYAIDNGHSRNALALLAAGADPNLRDKGGMTPLHWAAGHDFMSGNARLVARLLAAGADPTVRSRKGYSVLVDCSRRSTAQRLLAAGAR